jgi:hypothetical protein
MVTAIDSGTDVANSIVHMIGAGGNILPPAGGMQRYQPGQWMHAHRRGAPADRHRNSRWSAKLP